MAEQLALLPGYLGAHLRLSLLALLLGVAISVPLGVLVTRVRWLEQPVLGVASVIQTIPSLALLAIMVPILAAVDLPSIGFLPAFVGLVLYSVLPVLRNTVTGLSSVDPALIEAARGVGMRDGQRLYLVELPLAMPVIIAGVRTATIWTVGMATLSTPVGATSLGNFIFSGLQTRNQAAVLVGCLACAGLALGLDGLVRVTAEAWTQGRRGLLSLALAAIAGLYLWTGYSAVLTFQPSARPAVVIGSKTFTEQYILSSILAEQVQQETGLETGTTQSLGSTVAFDALCSGNLDVYVDYSGTIWATIMHRETSTASRAVLLAEVERYLLEEHGVVVAGALGFENAYALAMRRSEAERLGIRTISELSPHAPSLALGADYEFLGRAEWKALVERYGLHFAKERSMDSTLMYPAAAQGSVDVISAFSTDGRIKALDLRVLVDDRGAIPPYDALILASPQLARDHPEVIKALGALSGRISGDQMRAMNLQVDQDGQSPSAVAAQFLKQLRKD